MAAKAAGGATAAKIIAQVLIAVAISVASAKLLGKKPKVLDLGFNERDNKRRQVIRSSNEARRAVYGERLVSGVLVFAGTTFYAQGAEEDGYLHLVVALAGHEVEAIDDIWIGDKRIPSRNLDANGEVFRGDFFTEPDASYVRIKKHLGASDQAADADLVSEVTEWTTNHRLRGIAYVYVRLLRNNQFFPSGIPNIRALVRGKKVFDTRDSTTKYSDNPVLCIRDAMINELKLGITSSDFDETVLNAQANICDERVALTSVTDTFTCESIEALTEGRLLLTTEAEWFRFKTGDGVTITTTGTLPGGFATGSYFFIREDGGYFKLATTYQNALEKVALNIDLVSPSENVGSGTHTIELDDQIRYAANGVIEKEDKPIEVIEQMVTSIAGAVIWVAGQYEIHTGSATAATTTLTISDLRGPITVKAKPERRDLFNRVTATFLNPDNFWQPSDMPAVENATYVAEDNGVDLTRDIELPFTTDVTRAQRLSKIHLEKARQGISVVMPCKATVLTVRVWDTVNVTVDYLGWSSKKFRVLSVNFSEDFGGLDLTLQEEADTVYDWNFGEETTVDSAPDTNLPDPFNTGTVSGLTLQSGTNQLLEISEGSVISRIKVSWTEPSTPWADRYDIQFKRSSESDYTTAGSVQKGQTEFFIAPVEDGVMYDVRVRLISTLGGAGPYATELNHTVVGKTAPPSPPDSFNVTRLADGTRRYEWLHSVVPADVRSGGGYLIRYFVGSTSDWDSMTALHTGILQASPYESNELSAGTYTWAIKSIDSSGNESSTAVFVEGTIGDPRLRNVIAQRLEHNLGWPGTKTNCFVFGSTLFASTSLTIGDLPSTISALASTIAEMVARTDPIIYETPEIDLGADVSFTPLVATTGTGSVTVEMKTGTDADGGVVGAYVALETVSVKRYIQLRLTVTDPASPGVALRLDTATILFDGETQLDEYEDVNTATETASWFESVGPGHFRVASKSGNIATITSASIRAIQSGGVGYTWELVDKNAALSGSPTQTGAEFKLYDLFGSPTNVDSVVDIELKGPKIS